MLSNLCISNITYSVVTYVMSTFTGKNSTEYLPHVLETGTVHHYNGWSLIKKTSEVSMVIIIIIVRLIKKNSTSSTVLIDIPSAQGCPISCSYNRFFLNPRLLLVNIGNSI